MNTVAKSKEMAKKLQSETVRNWVQKWLEDNRDGQGAAHYQLEHLDASSNVTARENAKSRLAAANSESPHAVLNVGIFGEGTDAPSLSAVAFLESRKSPIDVIQAVGRAMRLSPGKERGYIICPILIPPSVDAESWLQTSGPEDGWQELGQILLALRAHDSRIEENLSELLRVYIPPAPETESTIIAIATEKTISYHGHSGMPGQAQSDIERILKGEEPPKSRLLPLDRFEKEIKTPEIPDVNPDSGNEVRDGFPAPALIITGATNMDGSLEMRWDKPVRDKPKQDGTPGPIDFDKSKKKARDMINKREGTRLPPRVRRTQKEVNEESTMRLLDLSIGDNGLRITANLLSKSGLRRDRVERDLNLLEGGVVEAARHMIDDGLEGVLNKHFGLDNFDEKKRAKQADGCTIGALIMMNAAMLHQRIAAGKWLPGIVGMAEIKNKENIVKQILRQWHTISSHDFLPILKPAIEVIEIVEDTGKLAGLERALHHITTEAERIAETYADMGSDHAGLLFNKVMGNQDSDGAFFTRPVAATIAARITLDLCGDTDWSDPDTWKTRKIVDLACGSGTLLAATMTDMKRRAKAQGTDAASLAQFQKIAVEETIKGLDINPVSLQLAASQLTSGNHEIRYRRMGLHLMPYGYEANNPWKVPVGTLELIGQRSIVPKRNDLFREDRAAESNVVWDQPGDSVFEDAVEAVKDASIVIMNPPFTNREKMGEKFSKAIQKKMREKTDSLERLLIDNDMEMVNFTDKNSIGPLFVALADRCVSSSNGILAMVNPTIALVSTSGQHERIILAQRFHIHTVISCHLPGQINMSQNTAINESVIIARRHNAQRAPTKFINLDRFPKNEAEVEDLHQGLMDCSTGLIANGWGEVSEWPIERIDAGDWSAAIWRSPILAEAATTFANHDRLIRLSDLGMLPAATGQQLRGAFKPSTSDSPGSFPILKSKSANAQTKIQGAPDEYWISKKKTESEFAAKDGGCPEADRILQKAGNLLITAGQRNDSARLTAVANDEKYVGNGWMPVAGSGPQEAKAIAIFLNSTVGRLQIMRKPGRTLEFPTYSAAETKEIRVPDLRDEHILGILLDCWERTSETVVPQFRDGECDVRRIWDEAVAEALGWDAKELARLRQLLHREPHVCGLGYNQYGDG